MLLRLVNDTMRREVAHDVDVAKAKLNLHLAKKG